MFKLFKPNRLVFKDAPAEAPTPEAAPAPVPGAPRDAASEKQEVNLDSIKFDAAKAKAQMLKSLDGMGYKLTKAEILEKAGKLKTGEDLSLAAVTTLEEKDIDAYLDSKGGDKYLNRIFNNGINKIKRMVLMGKMEAKKVDFEKIVSTGLSIEEYRNYKTRLSKFTAKYGKYDANDKFKKEEKISVIMKSPKEAPAKPGLQEQEPQPKSARYNPQIRNITDLTRDEAPSDPKMIIHSLPVPAETPQPARNLYLENALKNRAELDEIRLNNIANRWNYKVLIKVTDQNEKEAHEGAYKLLAKELARVLKKECGEVHNLPEESIEHQCERNNWVKKTEEKDGNNYIITLEFKESAKKALIRSYLEERLLEPSR